MSLGPGTWPKDHVGLAASVKRPGRVQVRRCAVLPLVLRVALAAGNFLNAGSRAGDAAGFQVGALLKLRGVRSTRARCAGRPGSWHRAGCWL